MTNSLLADANGLVTPAGRPAFVVNIEVFLEHEGRWLLIRRGAGEAHAPGSLAGVGGVVEVGDAGVDVLEDTARREVAEEIGVDLAGVKLSYVESSFFVTDDGDPTINVVFGARLPASARPVMASAAEVAELIWMTAEEAVTAASCPPWIRRSLGRAAEQAPSWLV
jgi:8-oxo-dGTP diphosphatase